MKKKEIENERIENEVNTCDNTLFLGYLFMLISYFFLYWILTEKTPQTQQIVGKAVNLRCDW